MTLFVDTSVWSLALRRDTAPEGPEVQRLREALGGGEAIYTTGIVLQELLQGFRGPKAKARIVERFGALAMIVPVRDDYIDAAESRNKCRRHGIQVGTIDALLAQLCIRHKLIMLATDRDFSHMTKWTPLQLWCPP